tara:strand:+ start:222 stop:380 length:159 start_codon:yes stop_codon:yes gene_type:complete
MTNDYQTLLEMWREEKRKRQQAEKEIQEIKDDNKKLAKQIEDLIRKKNDLEK